jgi:aspartyl-tRNA(Asn)/glutamyl-tRNA(Gln) amidotransferase subunit C
MGYQTKGVVKFKNHLYKIRLAVALIHYFCLMEVNDALVNKLATLARLRFNEAEKESIKEDLQKMIAFVQKMDEVDTDHVTALEHMSSRLNVWREDTVQGTCTKELALQNAGLHNKDFFMVPKVIKK